jgi:hypothetical protein
MMILTGFGAVSLEAFEEPGFDRTRFLSYPMA